MTKNTQGFPESLDDTVFWVPRHTNFREDNQSEEFEKEKLLWDGAYEKSLSGSLQICCNSILDTENSKSLPMFPYSVPQGSFTYKD